MLKTGNDAYMDNEVLLEEKRKKSLKYFVPVIIIRSTHMLF